MWVASIRNPFLLHDVAKISRPLSLPFRLSRCISRSPVAAAPSATAHKPSDNYIRFLTTQTPNMASFSNTDTGSKPADPYKEKNLQEPELKEKIEDLVKFVDYCKFGMMTTRIASSGLLTSRCMALAAKVRRFFVSLDVSLWLIYSHI